MARHPSAGARQPDPIRLYGRRVALRPLTPADFPEWSEVRRRNEAWLTPWEPRRPPTQLDPSLQPRRVRRPLRGPRPRRRGRASPTASACSSTTGSPARSTSTASCAGRCRAAPSATGSTRPGPGSGLIAESVVVVAAFAFEQLDLHRLEICIVPRNRNSRRVMEKLAIREEGIAQRFLEINGVWEDHVRYGFTVEEWTDRRDELAAAWL